jgi:hypothetical protein
LWPCSRGRWSRFRCCRPGQASNASAEPGPIATEAN